MKGNILEKKFDLSSLRLDETGRVEIDADQLSAVTKDSSNAGGISQYDDLFPIGINWIFCDGGKNAGEVCTNGVFCDDSKNQDDCRNNSKCDHSTNEQLCNP